MIGGVIFGTIRKCKQGNPQEEAMRLSRCKFYDYLTITSYLTYLCLVRQQNIERLAGSMISNDSEADTNGKINLKFCFI